MSDTAKSYECSKRMYERAAIIPGRSMTRSKAPGKFYDVGAGPLYASGGKGCMLKSIDGSEYIDMLCGLGAISLGYKFGYGHTPESVGGVYSLPHLSEVHAAEYILEHVAPWATRVRFTKTGSEATQAAFQIARRATGRPRVLIGDWAYHGWHSWVDDAIRFPHGMSFDLDFYERITRTRDVHYEDVAAVFIEPHRWESVNVSWLKHVRDWCTRRGALLIFDEMIYGARWGIGGATTYYNVEPRPDLACFGKAIGNGTPVACIVGCDVLAQHGELASGTYSGDAAGLSAVVDTLLTYTSEPVIDTLWKRGSQLARGLNEVVEHWSKRWSPLSATREGAPVHQRIRFSGPDGPALGKAFSAAMVKRGVLWHPDCVNVCYSHTEALIERVIESASCAINEVANVPPPHD